MAKSRLLRPHWQAAHGGASDGDALQATAKPANLSVDRTWQAGVGLRAAAALQQRNYPGRFATRC
jgi:hypothetical protein